jgi:uncharacterized protein
MKNIIGPPVEGDDFFGREDEMTYVWQTIVDGNSIILPAPRRVGKSSFAKKLLAIAKQKSWETIEINLEEIHTEPAFIALFIDKLKGLSWWEKAKDKAVGLLESFRSIKPTIKYDDVEVQLEWQRQREDVYKAIAGLLDHQKPTLVFFDELTVLLTSIAKAENGKVEVANFLHWLRSLRQVSGTKIRWIFCSSVGIENFAYAHQLSDTLNDVPPYHLKAFDVGTSLALIKALEKDSGIELDDSVRQAMLDKVRYYLPYFLQILFEKISATIKIEKAAINVQIVNTAYQALLDESYLNTWVERLKEQYGELEKDAFALLKHICQAEKGTKRDNLQNLLLSRHNDPDIAEDRLSTLLYMLRNDGYLMDEAGLYHFRSPLIRDFWYNRFAR